MRRAGLIALREIKAYTGTISFWAALAVGPILMILTALVAGPMTSQGPRTQTFAIEAADPRLTAAMTASLVEAGRLEGAQVKVVDDPALAQTRLTASRDKAGAISVETAGKPVSGVAWALLRRDLAAGGGPGDPMVVLHHSAAKDVTSSGVAAAGRFALVILLWMNLVGALGMLLQAIVRERANRALEILLTSARPVEILVGKLAGVALLSMIVVATWMGVGGLAAALAPTAGAGRAVAVLIEALSDPARLGLAAVVYFITFSMYGGAILGLSALAKDLPSAQNASRPIFGVLLAAFFIAIGMIGGGSGFAWLLWAPPFTPFVLLMQDPAALGPGKVFAALALMALTTCAVFAIVARAISARPAWRAPFRKIARS